MKKIILRIISMILLLCTFFIIFNFSAQDGEESGSLSNKITTEFINRFPYTKDLSAETKTKMIEHAEPIVRKLAHLSIYTVVGMCIMTFMCTFPIKLRTKLGTSLIVGLIYAVSDEWHQSFVPGRGPSIRDVCIDTTDVFLGIIIILIIASIYIALKKDNKEKVNS